MDVVFWLSDAYEPILKNVQEINFKMSKSFQKYFGVYIRIFQVCSLHPSMGKSGTGQKTSTSFGPYLTWTQLDWASLDLNVKWTSGPIRVDTYGH
jgi:hypothetical protein